MMVMSNGVVDPSIFGADDDIPSFLDRRGAQGGQVEAAVHVGADVSGVASAADQEAPHDEESGTDDMAAGVPSGDDEAGLVVAGDTVWDDVPPHDDDAQHVLGGELDAQAAAAFEAPVAGGPAHEQVAPPEHAPVGHNNPPPEPLTKEQMLRDFNRDVAAYGKDSGKGAAALPRLGLRVIRAAYDGLISNEKPKSGEKSDAVRIYEAYAANDSKHAEHTKGGMKANAAKLNALIGLGCMTTVDGVEIAERTVAIREKLEGADAKPKALFAGLVDVARAQLGQDTPLSDAAIEEALGKKEKEKTLAGEWEGILKKVETLISGENSHNLKDTSDAAERIYGEIKEHLNNFSRSAEVEQGVAWLMAKGMTREQALEIASK